MLGGLVQVGLGIAYLSGLMKPQTEGIVVPPEMEPLLGPITGVISIVIGLLVGITGLGVLRWRRWGRILAIVLCGLQLLGIVIVSFLRPLPLASIVSGVLIILLLVWLFHPRVQAAFATGGPQA